MHPASQKRIVFKNSASGRRLGMSDRHAFRAEWHNYNNGLYFVTICTRNKLHSFGYIKNCRMFLSDVGKIVEHCILDIANHHTNVDLVNHIIMPNHIHMVLCVGAQQPPVGTRYIASAPSIQPIGQNMGCLRPPRHGEPYEDFHHNSSLAVVVGTFKAAVTRLMRTRCIASLQEHERIQPVWQSRYHEHIIRNHRAFDNIMNYIDTNIEKWNKDCFYTT